MNSETKMNVANTLIWVSIITCALAIASIIGMLCISTDSPKEMQTDIQVDVLAITVTILIGWNIYQLIDVKGIRKEFENLKKSCERDIDELKKMQSIIDVSGGNKDKCAIIGYKPHKENSTVNDEIEKFYKSLGLGVSLVTMQFNGKENNVFFNGGLNDVYTEYLKTMLTSKFNLESVDISYKSIEEIGAMYEIPVKK